MKPKKKPVKKSKLKVPGLVPRVVMENAIGQLADWVVRKAYEDRGNVASKELDIHVKKATTELVLRLSASVGVATLTQQKQA